MADAHAAAGFRPQARGLGLVEQGGAVVGGQALAAGEAHIAFGVGAVDHRRRRSEVLQVQALTDTVFSPHFLHRLHHARRAAQEGRGLGVVGHGAGQLFAMEQTLQLAALLAFREGAQQFHIRVAGSDLGQLGGVDQVFRGIGVVQEADAAGVALVAQGAQHRHHRGDAAAAADQQHTLWALFRQGEGAVGLRQAHDHAGAGLVAQEFRDKAGRLGLGGQLDVVVAGMHRVGRRVAAGAAHAVDFDRQAHELAGAEALPVAIGAQCQRDAVGCLVAHGGHFGAHLINRPGRIEQFQVAVHAMRRGHCGSHAGTQDAAQAGAEEAGAGAGGDHRRLRL